MMKILFSITLLAISFASHGQPISYTQWNEEAKTDIRLLPKYGNRPKTREQRKADEQMVKDYLAQEGTQRKASDVLIRLGFDYLYRRELKTAMSRFNQAWLVDSTNENIYWGYGAVYLSFQDFKNTLVQYDTGLQLNPNSTNILTDKATAYVMQFDKDQKDNDLTTAINLFLQSYAINPKNQNTLFKLSACYFRNHDCANALKYYNECKALGGKPITQGYSEALQKECKK